VGDWGSAAGEEVGRNEDEGERRREGGGRRGSDRTTEKVFPSSFFHARREKGLLQPRDLLSRPIILTSKMPATASAKAPGSRATAMLRLRVLMLTPAKVGFSSFVLESKGEFVFCVLFRRGEERREASRRQGIVKATRE